MRLPPLHSNGSSRTVPSPSHGDDGPERNEAQAPQAEDGNLRRRIAAHFKSPPRQAVAGERPPAALQRAIESWEAKANWNKNTAQWGTCVIVLSGAVMPIALFFSTQPQATLLGKTAPLVLVAIGAAAAGWLQFHRPYAEWALFRKYQRRGERERLRFDSNVKPYDKGDPTKNEKLLAENLLELQRRLQCGWAALLPHDDEIADASDR